MIPIKLILSGFLSYRERVELDFTGFDLACISGPNGAGKSSLLDAITWALFGQARKRDDSIIHSHPSVKAAEVELIFDYENDRYRILRTSPRGKTGLLEFYILQQDSDGEQWRTLSEHSNRETQARIERTLRLDYETFVNASFFLQGKADQFTQQRPGDRKRILSSILGLEAWDVYRQRAGERRKRSEDQITAIEGRLHEINAELGEETQRVARLKTLKDELERISRVRSVQEEALEEIRKVAATLQEQQRLVATLGRQAEASTRQLEMLSVRLASRQDECNSYMQLLARAAEIQASYQAWQQARQELERWEQTAGRFREQEKLRQAPLDEINAERARLEQEALSLEAVQRSLQAQVDEQAGLQTLLNERQSVIAQTEAQLAQREALENELSQARQRLADARAENPRLKSEMDELKVRIEQIKTLVDASCPFCGQSLSPEHRLQLIDELTAQGKEKGDRFRANKTLLDQADDLVSSLQTRLSDLARLDADLRAGLRAAEGMMARLGQIEASQNVWQETGLPRLLAIRASLEVGLFSQPARSRLAVIDAQLKATGYDAAAHDAVRQAELQGRASENELRELEKAQAALASLDREIGELSTQHAALQAEQAHQQADYQQAAAAFQQAESQAPDQYQAERDLFDLIEQENRLRMEVGAAQQAVLVLDDLKTRRSSLQTDRDQLALQVGRFKQLERSFGKDGVPALLIEQALPQIEERANRILDRLSGGMSVRFVTQATYKDKRRDDRRETLDILISDSNGTRDYEMYSGGEAFRVNFAVRLALSEVLAQRAGARLQTLVIDEGFGSQDTLGRQRLVEAINLIQQDFAKIIIITHIDELKDAFPNRIEVEKSERGSMVRVI